MPWTVGVAFVAATVVTALAYGVFALAYRNCSELGCLGIVLFIPVAAIGSLISALIAGAQSRRGGQGYGVALIAGTFGFFVGFSLVQALV